ncbi:MAG: patatin-like phospholipase family protein [Bacteriovorax sp.]|nr:patatin-like phospholipase family protein [Bacteriovorax sp.]
MDEKLAIVLNGGGARGSYQAGVLRAIYEIVKKDQNLFDLITGNSAGAINAIFLANSARDWGASTQYLLDLWKRIKPEYVFDISNYAMAKLGSRWMKGTVFRNSPSEDPFNGILNTDPLRKLIQREVDFKELHHLIQEKYISGVALSTTNYYSGSSIVFFDAENTIPEWAKPDRFSIRTELNVEHVMASSAIPLFFPPAKIQQSYYGDGCIRQSTPLSPAIHLGATKIITIGIRHKRSFEMVKDIALQKNPPPLISQIGGVMMDAIFLDSLDADVERLEKINIMVEIMGKHSPWRHIPILSLNPSRDLGAMTQQLSSEMPKFLRYFLSTIGITGQSGMDLLSYLAFDSVYTEQVTELGYEDTYKQKKEILNFLD